MNFKHWRAYSRIITARFTVSVLCGNSKVYLALTTQKHTEIMRTVRQDFGFWYNQINPSHNLTEVPTRAYHHTQAYESPTIFISSSVY